MSNRRKRKPQELTMPTDQDQETIEVATGLGGMTLPTEAVVPPSEPVSIAGLEDDVQVKVAEVNAPAAAAKAAVEATQDFTLETQTEAHNENVKRDFVLDVMAKRKRPEDTPYTPPPVPPAVVEQTRLEMEAGAKRVAEAAAQQGSRPRPKDDDREAKMVPVFRPADYAPNANQGQVPTQTARNL